MVWGNIIVVNEVSMVAREGYIRTNIPTDDGGGIVKCPTENLYFRRREAD